MANTSVSITGTSISSPTELYVSPAGKTTASLSVMFYNSSAVNTVVVNIHIGTSATVTNQVRKVAIAPEDDHNFSVNKVILAEGEKLLAWASISGDVKATVSYMVL